MKTKANNTISKHDITIRRKCIKGGLSIGFGNGYAAAWKVIESAVDDIQSDQAFRRAVQRILRMLEEQEVELMCQHEEHLDDYIV